MSEILTSIENGIGRITLNRPEALHSLNKNMCGLITVALKDWQNDEEVKAILIDHAEGTRGFCAGGDIRMLAESGAKGGAEARAFFALEYKLNTLIHNYSKPYIAVLDGVTMGGGLGISVHGDIRIATENTLAAMPETGIGLFPDVGGGWFLPLLEGELGMWLALTGARLKGADAYHAGFATHFVSSEDVPNIKSQIIAIGVEGQEAIEDLLQGFASDAGAPSFANARQTIDDCFGKESAEEIVAALEADGSDFAQKQLETLNAKSPQTIKVAFRQLREGAKFKTFEENMRNEYRIASKVPQRHDFIEGVRAVIIEKDNEPKWNPATLEGVTEAMLDEIFAPLGDNELDV